MYDPHKAELKQEKKQKKLFIKSAWAAGLGLGLLLLKFAIVPFLGENEQAESALGIFAWCLIGYGVALVLSFVFLRKFIGKINFVLSWLVMPTILIKLLMDFL